MAEVESFHPQMQESGNRCKEIPYSEDDYVLIIDDFLANGCALQGLIQIVKAAGGYSRRNRNRNRERFPDWRNGDP